MISGKNQNVYYLVIHPYNCILGSAKEKLSIEPTFKFRIQFEYKLTQNDINGIKIKTAIIELKEGIMTMPKEALIFKNINRFQGEIEATMMLGGSKSSKKFKPKIILIKNFEFMKNSIETWNFSQNSKLTLNYKLTSNYLQIQQFCQENEIKMLKIMEYETQIINDNLNRTSDLIKFKDDANQRIQNVNLNKFPNENNKNNKRQTEENMQNEKISIKKKINLFESLSKKNSVSNISNIKSSKILDNGDFKNNQVIPLLSTKIKENFQYNSFCEGFLIVSFPQLGAEMIENSIPYRAMCGHVTCSKLPAMEPQIIYRYPLNDTKSLELNNLVASLCFPEGIKVCYNQDRRSTCKNFVTPITNQQGERYYMTTYHFYYKIETNDYNGRYENNPLKAYLRKFGNNIFETEEKKIKLENELEICTDLGFKEEVYIPYCIALISKFPYIKQMELCLNSIFKVIASTNMKEKDFLNNFITYLIKCIPIPPYDSKLSFTIPLTPLPVEIYNPLNPLVNIRNLILVMENFSIDNIIYVYRLILFEEKILFIDREYSRLSQIIESFISLLYPIEWINPYIPIMSEKMTIYLQTFLPYINGIHEDLIINNAKNALDEAEDGIFLININEKTIKISKNQTPNIPELPKEMTKKLKKELTELQDLIKVISKNEKEKYYTEINNLIRNCFIESFCVIFYDFMEYLYNIGDDYTIFNTEMLIKNRANDVDSRFYKEFTETQIFQNLIQNIPRKQKKYLYFFNILNTIKEKKEKNETLIKSFNLNSIKNYKNEYENSNTLNAKFTYLISEYKQEGEEQIISESKRNIESLNEIDDTLYVKDKEINRYIIPEMEVNLQKKIEIKKSIDIITKVDIYEKNIQKNTLINAQNNLKMSKIRNMKKSIELTDKEKSEIREIIKDSILLLFKSDFKNIQLERCLSSLYLPFGRDYFTKLLYQTNFSIKKLQENCFIFLTKLCLNSLISLSNENETMSIVECGVMLTKASFYYCKGQNENYLLIDELREKIKDYFLWVKDSFWNTWIKIQLRETEEKETIQLISNNDDKYYNLILSDLINKMLRLKINKEYIASFCKKVIEKKLIDDKLLETAEEEIILKISNYIYK